jgi:hypothetical protein
VDVTRIADGLWRWTTPHPDWDEAGTGAAAWPRAVGCVYVESSEATVLIDPLVPDDPPQRERFYAALDRDVTRRGLPVTVLRSVTWHERSCQAIVDRYGAGTTAPSDVLVHEIGDPEGEQVFELMEYGALVVADVLVGSDVIDLAPGAVALCPPSWYDGSDDQRAWYRERSEDAVARLAARPIERVLVSHGTPVLSGGRAALAGAVALTRRS